MRDHQPQLVQSFLEKAQKKSILQYIYQRSTILNEVRLLAYKVIPESLHPWYNIANIHQNTLILNAANANYLMCLHYEKINLLKTLQKKILPSLKFIHIKIDPAITIEATKTTQDHHD
ncbi:DciA family protein [Candidatus Erwinia haradaeae]|uniref:Dna[CI] antecedent, DciA family protein, partial n=1 Tax=Candidatus Erwinia haradaeae TaxID=1922217 RepID=A0A451D4A5_9GAMM|nr:DciA family protein [Candidatus Erwinia haradaeae]VFP80520.1 Dna[CI] antecedent, DciA family protein [Candidatus Erwinia haradaeae]